MTSTSRPDRPSLAIPAAAPILLGALALMWVIEVLDTVLFDDWFQSGGLHPRRIDGLDGILWAPVLHDGFGHLIGNSIPFVVLGGLVAFRGLRTFVVVTAVVIVAGGAATWLLARSGNHIGASGVIFGYLGYLLAAAWFEKSVRAVLLALVAGALYWTLVFGLLPTGQVSWEGHLFGAAAGFAAAYWLHGTDEATPSALG